MKYIILTLLSLISATASKAQYISSGKIEYVKTTNIHLSYKLEFSEQFGDQLENFIKMVPKNSTKFYVMTFDANKSFYKFDKDGPEKLPQWGGKDPMSENIVVKDYATNNYTAQKEAFDNIFIVKDSIPKLEWKIEDEVRQIAGYSCRKATTVINDSVVVIAYYSDQIMLQSGPESFGGLPGMILGLAVPRLYSSWFATKVESAEYDPTLETKMAEKRTKTVTHKGLIEALEPTLKEWGSFGQQVVYKAIL